MEITQQAINGAKSQNNYNENYLHRFEAEHTAIIPRNKKLQNQSQHQMYKTENLPNYRNMNTCDGRGYAQVTHQTSLFNTQNQNNNNDATEIKELLKECIKDTEMVTNMISELNAVLGQQTQQITIML